uniref:KIND domain-containing protein n=1 Tax=Callorhinchus milii TaxID=7868 RepID=A0A4W3J0D0_CALMI
MAVAEEVFSLEAMLIVQGQPVSEEQAWALCYQSCQGLLTQEQGEPQPRFERIDNLTLFQDGSVVCVPANGNSSLHYPAQQIYL